MEWKRGGGEENRKTIQGWIWSKLCAHMEMLQQISLHQIMSILNEKMNIDKQEKKERNKRSLNVHPSPRDTVCLPLEGTITPSPFQPLLDAESRNTTNVQVIHAYDLGLRSVGLKWREILENFNIHGLTVSHHCWSHMGLGRLDVRDHGRHVPVLKVKSNLAPECRGSYSAAVEDRT